MRFFRIEPVFDGDENDVFGIEHRDSPVLVGGPHLPSLDCPHCGVWASSDRLRHVQPFPGLPERFVALTPEAWRAQAQEWAARLGVPASALAPGAYIGPARAVVYSTIRHDLVCPFPGDVWATPRAASVLVAASLAGVLFVPVSVQGPRGDPRPLVSLEPMGRVRRRGSRTEDNVLCHECGRTGFPRPGDLTIDPSTWSGTDLFTVDDNPNILFATERFREVVRSAGLTGIEFEEVDVQRALPPATSPLVTA